MKLRSVACTLALTFALTGLAEAKKTTRYVPPKTSKLKVHKYNPKKANKAARKALAKRRKQAA
jgi:hypothetical protein